MSQAPAVPDELTVFERRLVRDARRWLDRDPGVVDRALGGTSSRTRSIIDRAIESEAVQTRLRTATDEVVARLSDAFERRVADVEPLRPERDGERRAEALRRTEEEADSIATRYVGAMTVEGIAAGAASLTPVTAAISFLPDLAAALALSVQACAHLLALYGVTPPGPETLEAGLQVASAATDTDPRSRRGLFLDLAASLEEPLPARPSPERISRLIVQQAGARALRETVEHTLRRVARRRLTVFVPIVGVAVHGAASGWLGGQACDASRHLGRVVYLARSGSWSAAELLGVAAVE